jgi:transcriptional regulator with XRE-family HTH domain
MTNPQLPTAQILAGLTEFINSRVDARIRELGLQPPHHLSRRELRTAKGWGIDELADRAGVSKSTVSNAENGKNIQAASLQKIARTLGVTPEEYLRAGCLRNWGGDMKPIQVHTDNGDISVSFTRRKTGGPWHIRFWFKNQEYRQSTKLCDLKQARTVARDLVRQACRDISRIYYLDLAVRDYLEDRTQKQLEWRLKKFLSFTGSPELDQPDERITALVSKYLDARK